MARPQAQASGKLCVTRFEKLSFLRLTAETDEVTQERAIYSSSAAALKVGRAPLETLHPYCFWRLDARIDSNVQIELATERVHHDASPLSYLQQLFE